MGQKLTLEIDHMLAEMNLKQRRDVLLCIDEILTALDTASPAVDQWKTARRYVQRVGGITPAAMTNISTHAAPGVPAQGGN